MNHHILNLLSGSDMRSLKNVDLVVRQARTDRTVIHQLVGGFDLKQEARNMRIADALEKISAEHHEALEPYVPELINILHEYHQKEIRWHMAQILPRLTLTPQELTTVRRIWKYDFHTAHSKIVRVFSLQALVDTCPHDREKHADVVELLRQAMKSGVPSLEARARLLIRTFYDTP